MNGKTAFEHGGNLYAAVRRQGGCLSTLLDFSANINPLGLSEGVRQALYDSLECIVHYPDAEAYALKEAISRRYGVDRDLITAGNGAVEPIYILCHMLKPARVLVTAPTFSEYERAAKASGARVEYFYLLPEHGFAIDIAAMMPLVSAVDMVFIGNPNNPTGTLLTNREIEPLLAMAKEQGTIVVVDESFLDFLFDDSEYTCRHLLSRYSNLVIVHSLTKFYAIPGLRLGFALANASLTGVLHSGKDPWNVNSLAQSAGVAALNDEQYRVLSKELVYKAKEELYSLLGALPGLVPYYPAVNFILVNIEGTGMNAGQLSQALLAHNVLIRDCSNYPGLSAGYIRLAVKQPAQNAVLVNALQSVVRK